MKSKAPTEIERYNPPAEVGLTEAQVSQRIKSGLINKVNNNYSKSYKQILFDNLFTYFNLLYVLVTIALLMFNNADEIGYLFIIIPNILISIIQEINAKHTIAKLSLISSNTTTVIRQGAKTQIQTSAVVLDEIIVLSSGNQIVADSVVVSGEIEVNEALLTGESASVKKITGDKLLAGSYVVAGNCVCRAINVGKTNYIEGLKAKVQKHKKTNSEILISLNKLITIIGVLIPLVAFFTGLVVSKIQGTENISTIVATVAGPIIGMIPAGLFLLTTITLTVSVINLANNKALVQDIYCIEMLSRVDVLCFDKTGTITDGNMKVSQVQILNKQKEQVIDQLLLSLIESTKDNSTTANAIYEYCTGKKIKPLPTQAAVPFNSKCKQSAITIDNVTYHLGAAEYVLNSINNELADSITSLAKKGFRVMVLAASNDKLTDGQIGKADNVIALITLREHIRPDIKQTINYFNTNGVKLLVISGDNEYTVSEIARQAGIVDSDKVISLNGMTDEQVCEAANKYNVFCRVNPEQKHLIVKSLRQAGHVVGMTGDGINDILALKEADCSISMASGSAAARNASQLVLLDSDFTKLPLVVSEGRKVINNIQRTSSLYLMKTIFTTVFAVICILSFTQYPFTAKQFLVLEMFVIGLPSVALALQPNKDIVKGKFLRNILANAFPSGLSLVICITALFTINLISPFGAEELKAMSSITLSLSGVMMLMFICLPLNRFRLTVLVSSFIAVILAYIIFWNSADLLLFKFGLGLIPLKFGHFVTCGIIALMSVPIKMLLSVLIRRKNKDL